MSTLNARRRTVLALAAAMMVASCQMVPDARFTSAQRAVLEKHGFEKVGGRYLLGINNRLLFPFDSSEIDPVQRDMLRDLARELAGVGIGSASIEGHSSSEGDAQHNLRLSERRAGAVRDALAIGGLDRARMGVRGVGALDPVASNDDEAGRRQNRRVVIIVTPLDTLAW
jgi:OOP family OmpA-OmpF porin